jgi:hypothetical protein
MRLEIPREHRKQHIGPGTRALFTLIDGGHIRPAELTVSQREDIAQRVLLINKQAQEEYIATVLITMETVTKPDLGSANAQTPGEKKRKRGRPKGSPLLKSDLSLVHKMVAAYHIAHIEDPSEETDPSVPNQELEKLLQKAYDQTRDVDNLLRQATQEASQEAKTTTAESIRHRLVSRHRKCEINPQDLSLAGFYFHEFARAMQELPVGFASKSRRRKNRS